MSEHGVLRLEEGTPPTGEESAQSLLSVEADGRGFAVTDRRATGWRVKAVIATATALAAVATLTVAARGGGSKQASLEQSALEEKFMLGDAPYDCNAGYANWRHGWSTEKINWCCHHKGMGCSDFEEIDHDVAPDWGNAHHGTPGYHGTYHGTVGGIYDCNAGGANWESGWSVPKRNWCCQNTGRGCSGYHPRPPSYHPVQQPIYHDHHPRLQQLAQVCSYNIGQKVSVNLPYYGWSQATILENRQGGEGYNVMVEDTGMEKRVRCSQIRAATWPVWLMVLIALSVMAIIISLSAACGFREQYCGWKRPGS